MTKRRLPAEWEPQSGIMLSWPHTASDWKAILKQVEPVFVEISLHASRHQKVLIVCYDLDHQKAIQSLLENNRVTMNNVVFAVAKSNDSWARDHGPISVWDNGRLLLLDFQFNAWGGKYKYALDNAITDTLYQQGVFSVNVQAVPWQHRKRWPGHVAHHILLVGKLKKPRHESTTNRIYVEKTTGGTTYTMATTWEINR